MASIFEAMSQSTRLTAMLSNNDRLMSIIKWKVEMFEEALSELMDWHNYGTVMPMFNWDTLKATLKTYMSDTMSLIKQWQLLEDVIGDDLYRLTVKQLPKNKVNAVLPALEQQMNVTYDFDIDYYIASIKSQFENVVSKTAAVFSRSAEYLGDEGDEEDEEATDLWERAVSFFFSDLLLNPQEYLRAGHHIDQHINRNEHLVSINNTNPFTSIVTAVVTTTDSSGSTRKRQRMDDSD